MDLERKMTAFRGSRLIRSGPIKEVLPAVKAALDDDENFDSETENTLLIFDDRTGTQVDFDLRGSSSDVMAALAVHPFFISTTDTRSKGRVGRPKLGVTAREVTLLPRHWAWLETQQSGASATLRRLVEAEMKRAPTEENARAARVARDATGKVMWSLAGNLPGFEEASRVLYKGDASGFKERISAWPADIREYLTRLAKGRGL